ncbi:hypothetical protein ACWCSH_39540 [Streptosporangium sp. NPDC001682]
MSARRLTGMLTEYTIDQFTGATSGSRRSGRGARPPVSSERIDRRWPIPPAVRPLPPSGGSSPHGSSVRSRGTPATSRWPRTSPRRRWPRHS